MNGFIDILDETLRRINSDYDAKRFKDLALRRPIVRRAPDGTFFNWMKQRGKLGNQNKVPRLANNREYVDAILRVMELVVDDPASLYVNKPMLSKGFVIACRVIDSYYIELNDECSQLS